MNLEDFPEDSDTSDDDYTPEGKPEEEVSEDDSDGEVIEPLSDSEEVSRRGKKRTKKSTKSRKKTKVCEKSQPAEEPKASEEEKKKKDEDIWADFMKDTGFQSRKSTSEALVVKSKLAEKPVSDKAKTDKVREEKVKITQIFEFAGEEVKVEKEVAADSAEARLLAKPSALNKPQPARVRGGLSGIGSVLNQLGKKPKISTLEKSKLDWDKFKKDEKIEEELQTYNKGKDGYLERQDFLQRADLRRFEIEKEVRAVERNRRMNNS